MGTYCVLSRFQKHLKCAELHNTVYCSEAASEKVLFSITFQLKKKNKHENKVLQYEAEYKVLGFQ